MYLCISDGVSPVFFVRVVLGFILWAAICHVYGLFSRLPYPCFPDGLHAVCTNRYCDRLENVDDSNCNFIPSIVYLTTEYYSHTGNVVLVSSFH